jgi:hypothetical protein
MDLIFVAIFVKHFICDFPLQYPYMFLNKGKYGHPGGLLHAAVQGTGTLAVCLGFGLPLWLAIADAVIHYHVDWTKNQLNDRFKLAPNNKYFWWLLGADQLAHYLTYAALVALA